VYSPSVISKLIGFPCASQAIWILVNADITSIGKFPPQTNFFLVAQKKIPQKPFTAQVLNLLKAVGQRQNSLGYISKE
jgi:hypothetical protein